MSAHRIRQDMIKSDGFVPDPGASGKIAFDKSIGVCPIVTTATETRTVIAPDRAGAIASIEMITDGGDATVTFPLSFNQTGNTIATFNDAGDTCTFISVPVAGAPTTFKWKLLTNDGASLS